MGLADSIVRILDAAGKTAGTGFVVEGRRIVTCAQHAPLNPGLEQAFAVQFSPDNRYFAMACLRESVALWDLEKQSWRIFSDHQGSVIALAFSSDSRFVASGDQMGNVLLSENFHVTGCTKYRLTNPDHIDQLKKLGQAPLTTKVGEPLGDELMQLAKQIKSDSVYVASVTLRARGV